MQLRSFIQLLCAIILLLAGTLPCPAQSAVELVAKGDKHDMPDQEYDDPELKVKGRETLAKLP